MFTKMLISLSSLKKLILNIQPNTETAEQDNLGREWILYGFCKQYLPIMRTCTTAKPESGYHGTWITDLVQNIVQKKCLSNQYTDRFSYQSA